MNPHTKPPTSPLAATSLIWAQPLDVQGLLIYTLSACMVAWLGFFWFQKTRKGFADVL